MNPTLPSRTNRLARLALLLLWIGCLLWLSLSPNPPRPTSELLSWDKLQHAGAYALLTLLFGLSFSQWQPLRYHPWLLAWLAAVLFGGIVEILQGTLTDVRQAESGDLLANAAGGLLALLAVIIRNLWLRHKTTSA